MRSGKERLAEVFRMRRDILSIFCTGGFPEYSATGRVVAALAKAGADLVELGVPFSDSLVDGPTIQMSNEQALKQGMTLRKLLEQIAEVQPRVSVPVVLMSALNPVLQFGVEPFVEEAARSGVAGVILPDLPPEVFERDYKRAFDAAGLAVIFLVTSRTDSERIRYLDRLSSGFLYVVSTDATTGGAVEVDLTRTAYFRRLRSLKLDNPLLVGFGISDREGYLRSCAELNGVIIGSAFVRALSKGGDLEGNITRFVESIRGAQ